MLQVIVRHCWKRCCRFTSVLGQSYTIMNLYKHTLMIFLSCFVPFLLFHKQLVKWPEGNIMPGSVISKVVYFTQFDLSFLEQIVYILLLTKRYICLHMIITLHVTCYETNKLALLVNWWQWNTIHGIDELEWKLISILLNSCHSTK